MKQLLPSGPGSERPLPRSAWVSYLMASVCSEKSDAPPPPEQDGSHAAPTITEMSTLIMFLLEVLPLVNVYSMHVCKHTRTHTPTPLNREYLRDVMNQHDS